MTPPRYLPGTYPSEERTAALDGWLWHYNHHRRHSAPGHQPPITRVTNLPGTWRAVYLDAFDGEGARRGRLTVAESDGSARIAAAASASNNSGFRFSYLRFVELNLLSWLGLPKQPKFGVSWVEG
jgi:hypothetical protein